MPDIERVSPPKGSVRADERTRTAYPCSLRVITQALQGFARACKCRIFRRLSLLRVAACCTELLSRWYQSGIRTSDSYSLTSDPMAPTHDLRSHNPPNPAFRCCPMLRKTTYLRRFICWWLHDVPANSALSGVKSPRRWIHVLLPNMCAPNSARSALAAPAES
jgi:hypothetical protein